MSEFISSNLGLVIGLSILVLVLILHKPLMRLFGVIIVTEDKIGLVNKIFRLWGGPLQIENGIIAINKEAGMQAQYLSSGVHFLYWPWKYKIELVDFVTISKDQVGLIESKDGKPLEQGAILANYVDCENFQDAVSFLTKGGFKGKQTKVLTPGVYKINKYLFNVTLVNVTSVEQNKVGVITTLDGKSLPTSEIAGKEIAGHNSFQDVDSFIKVGGFKGLQSQVIQSGTYYLNPWFVKLEQVPMTVVPVGNTGVIVSYTGEDGKDTTGDLFGHGNIVTKGQKGVWLESMDPGKYPINPYTTKVEIVPTTNIVLNWATGKNESHDLDKNLSTIKVRSKDGFTFNLDVSQIIHIPSKEASKVIARFGSMMNLISQVLEPTIGNYFRNSAQDSDVIEFLSTRKERQTEAKDSISKVIESYNIVAVDTLIGDLTPPEALMQTLTDRKIAQEQQKTFTIQKDAQTNRQEFEKAKSIADMQEQIVKASQGVEISEKTAQQEIKKAEGAAKSIELVAAANSKKLQFEATGEAAKIQQIGDANAKSILAQGLANAESYREQVKAMGSDNFAKLKIINAIAEGKVELMPKVLITGNGSGNSSPVDALLGFSVLKQIDPTIIVDSNKK